MNAIINMLSVFGYAARDSQRNQIIVYSYATKSAQKINYVNLTVSQILEGAGFKKGTSGAAYFEKVCTDGYKTEYITWKMFERLVMYNFWLMITQVIINQKTR